MNITISKFINNLLIVITMLAFIAQLFIDLSTVNIAASMIILLSAFICFFYFRWSNALETNPLSSFAIFGLCFTSTIGALWAQSFGWVNVVEHLRQPLVTLSWLMLFQITAIVAHCVHRFKLNSGNIEKLSIVRKLFNWMGIYDTPTPQILWIIGIFGLFCVLFSRILPVANGFSYLAWSPFLIPIFYYYEGKSYCNLQKSIFYLAIFFSAIVLLAMFFNARGMMFTGGGILGSVLLLRLMQSPNQVNPKLFLPVFITILIAFALSIPASNLATAMAIARDGRGKISPIKMISNTIENFNDPEKLENYRHLENQISSNLKYNEVYVDNPLAARFVQTQRHDNMIYFAGRINDNSAELVLQKEIDFLWSTLPQPFLDALKIDIDKRLLSISMGDVIAHYAIGTPLSGSRTGSVFAQGLLLLGYFSVPIYLVMCLILFGAIDLFAKKSANGFITFSIVGMLSLWSNFGSGIVADSFHQLFMGVVRGVFQTAILYFIAFFFAKFLTKSFSLKTSSSKYSSNNKLTG